jgi:3-oxoadipate enol-lactonase
MSRADADGVAIEYRVDGREDGPVLLLSNSLGTRLSMWDAQVPVFGSSFRVVRYDIRGHGASDAPEGPYTIDQLGADALAVLDSVGAERGHVCGISLGGLTAIWLAARHPERVETAVFAGTAARIGTPDLWEARASAVLAGGMRAVTDIVVARFFSEPFRSASREVVADVREDLATTRPLGYASACLALRGADLREELGAITARSLVVVGSEDVATPLADAQWLRDHVPGATLAILEGAGHLCSLEQPEAFADRVVRFLTEEGPR